MAEPVCEVKRYYGQITTKLELDKLGRALAALRNAEHLFVCLFVGLLLEPNCGIELLVINTTNHS